MYLGNYCGKDLANMILKSKNGCQHYVHEQHRSCGGWDSGACALLEEAKEYHLEPSKWSNEQGEEFNEEASGSCNTYDNCCKNGNTCEPSKLSYSECC